MNQKAADRSQQRAADGDSSGASYQPNASKELDASGKHRRRVANQRHQTTDAAIDGAASSRH